MLVFLAGILSIALAEHYTGRRLYRGERLLLAIGTAVVTVGSYFGVRALQRQKS
jgi:hypothetical protein